MRNKVIISTTAYFGAVLAVAAFGQPEQAVALREAVAKTRARFPATTIATVITSADGMPIASLGLTNMKAVLPGLLYRSGNMPRRRKVAEQRREAIPRLRALACAGFGRVIYHYSPVFGDTAVKCSSSSTEVVGTQSRPTIDDKALVEALTTIHAAIRGNDHRPVLLQCNYGKHASAYTAAIALRQFCGLSGRAAVLYWQLDAGRDRDLDDGKASELRSRIASFPDRGALKRVSNSLTISRVEGLAVCPESELARLEASASHP